MKNEINASTYITHLIQVLYMLRTNKILKVHDFMKEFEVSEKTVRRYINQLKALNFDIESKTGKYGGYILNEPNLTELEWDILKLALKDNNKIYEKIKYRLEGTI